MEKERDLRMGKDGEGRASKADKEKEEIQRDQETRTTRGGEEAVGGLRWW